MDQVEWTQSEREYGTEHIGEGRALNESGDLGGPDFANVEEFRQKYTTATGHVTKLTDDQIIHLAMSADDAYGLEWHFSRVASAEEYFDKIDA